MVVQPSNFTRDHPDKCGSFNRLRKKKKIKPLGQQFVNGRAVIVPLQT